MEAKQLYEFDKDLTGGIPIRQMIGTFDIYKLRWNKKRNEENANRKKSIISEIARCISPEPGIHELDSKIFSLRDPFESVDPWSGQREETKKVKELVWPMSMWFLLKCKCVLRKSLLNFKNRENQQSHMTEMWLKEFLTLKTDLSL